MKYDLVVFDLDGTVLNTLDDLADACNAALSEAGFPTRDRDDVRRFIGNGVANLMRRACPEGTDEATVARALERFKALYMAHINDRTLPYPGIVELLKALKAKGIRTAVNSNKLDAATQRLIRAHFGTLIDVVLGERADIPKKPAPDGAFYIMKTLGVSPDRAIYVGDGDADIRTAQNAGIDGAWVSWGYRRREELEGLQITRAFGTVAALRAYLLDE